MSEHIICYDIANPRRLARVHKLLKKQALPLQYSVFLFSGTDTQLKSCLTQLQAIINPHEDDIRAYPLPQRDLRLVLGPSTLPEGITLGSLPTDPTNHPPQPQPQPTAAATPPKAQQTHLTHL
ncbi:MAG: CRISPR-associated endonuclease Cas2 [Pseudomonadota bacterium]|nr:CRISPR-associated endonuclease Cas2 [Pseudomonadota bacterium]